MRQQLINCHNASLQGLGLQVPATGCGGERDASQVQGFYRIASQCACSLIPQTPFPSREQGSRRRCGVLMLSAAPRLLRVQERTERWCCVAILRVATASIALTPGPAPARGSGVARSDGVRAFQRVRTQNTPWVEPMFCPPFNRSGSEVWGEGSGKNPTPERRAGRSRKTGTSDGKECGVSGMPRQT
jgi:hypothetical protein